MSVKRKKQRRHGREATLAMKETVLRLVMAESGPPPERAQHGELDSGGAVSPIERLHRDGEIDATVRDACVRWHRDYLVGIGGVREPATGSGQAGDGEARSLIAAEHWREACEALGPGRAAVLTWLVIEERGWTWMAQRLTASGDVCGWQTAQSLAVLCAADLAAWYAQPRRRKKAIDTPS